jgi:hypothetical protein
LLQVHCLSPTDGSFHHDPPCLYLPVSLFIHLFVSFLPSLYLLTSMSLFLFLYNSASI